jgi:hypothetical protein
MSRFIIALLLLLILPTILFGQIDWTEHIIDTTARYEAIYALDLDDDNDVDVVGVGWGPNVIVWWENDGNENFTKHNIDEEISSPKSVYATDLDNDNDVDILVAAWLDQTITWWENDSEENFTGHIIAEHILGAWSVYAIDVEPDGDVDVLGGGYGQDAIKWWENDGDENFTEHTVQSIDSIGVGGFHTAYASDLDEDGDMDILGAASISSTVPAIVWWENDGKENFTEHVISNDTTGCNSIYAIDLDNDTDVDIVSGPGYASDITWWENDGEENFIEHAIAGNITGAWSIYAIDLDNSNGIDILGGSSVWGSNSVVWWENDGNENFTLYIINDDWDGANAVHAIDIDDDGDRDVLGAYSVSKTITWWENNLIAGIEDVTSSEPNIRICVNPNPFRDATTISFGVAHSAKDIGLKIYDTSGRLVNQFNHLPMQPSNRITWDGTDHAHQQLPGGVYFLYLHAGDFQANEKLLLIR